MAEDSFNQTVDMMEKGFLKGLSSSGFFFDGDEDSLKAIEEKLDARKSILEVMKSKLGGSEATARDVVALKTQMDFVTRIRRDLQLRYRNYSGFIRRSGRSYRTYCADTAAQLRKTIGRIEK